MAEIARNETKVMCFISKVNVPRVRPNLCRRKSHLYDDVCRTRVRDLITFTKIWFSLSLLRVPCYSRLSERDPGPGPLQKIWKIRIRQATS